VSVSLSQRFWAKVDKSGECWEWRAAHVGKPQGYGYFWMDGGMHLAHRVAYVLSVGPVPEGMELDHICRNRACVRPAHLRVATKKQNMENRGLDKNNTSGVRGVSWSKQMSRWRGHVTHENRYIHVGYFTDLRKAEAAVVAKRLAIFTHNERDQIMAGVRPDKMGA
jgi:hypothetical protein